MAKIEKLVARAEPVLARLVRNASMVEVGVFAADLAVYLLERRPDIKWLGVDSWLGTNHQPQAYRDSGDVHAAMSQAQQDELMALSFSRVRRFGERATIWRTDSVDAARRVAPESVDLVFLDADHSREGAARDVDAWWPAVKRGALLAGHDYLNKDRRFTFGVNLAVDAFVKRERLKLVLDQGTCWFVRKPSGGGGRER